MKRILKYALYAVLCATGSIAFAQPPQLSEVERLKIENLQLKATVDQTRMQQLQNEMGDIEKQYREIVADVEKAHPGYTLNGTQLVEKPKKAEPKK